IAVGDTVYVGSSSGELYGLNVTSGSVVWSTNVGAAISAPDEQNVAQPLTGVGAGRGLLVVPAGDTLVAESSGGGPPRPGGLTPWDPPMQVPSDLWFLRKRCADGESQLPCGFAGSKPSSNPFLPLGV